jgi:putative ABC transport system permease protein
VAVAILALGLSAGIGVFTYFNGFHQPFPGVDADRLVQLFDATEEDPYANLSYLDYVDYAAGATGAFEDVAAIQSGYAASIRHDASTEVVFLEAVSGNYFPLLQVEMSAGRALSVEDDIPGAEPVAVISYGWWQRQWNGDPSVIGSVVHFNFRPHTVVGVTSPRFRGSLASYRPDAWLPFEPFKARYTSWASASERRDLPLVRVHARLRDGIDHGQAAEELRRLSAGLDEVYPREAAEARRPALAPATWIDPRARVAESGTVRMMMAAAVGLLLLVCANVGNLLLAIATGRRREMALRSAMGASRGRLLRQVLTESVLLAGAAGLAALVFAGPVAMRLGSYFARPSVWGENVAREMTLDSRVVWFALAASLVTSVLAGLLPALSAGRRNLVDTLKAGDGDGEGNPRKIGSWRVPGARDLMVSAQVGLSLVLLVVAGLTMRTLANVGELDPGFDHESMIASYVSTSSTGVTVEERDLWFRNLAERLTEEPWIRSATISSQAPLSPHASTAFRLEGADEEVDLVFAPVIPGFFETLGMDVVRGRDFSVADSLGAPGVAMVNEVLVDRFFPGGDGVGRRVWRSSADGSGDQSFEIVGVVSNARVRDFLAEPEPVVYLANPQQGYASGSALTIATTIDPAAAVPRLYQWLRDFESHIAIVNVLPYTDVVRGFTYAQRMNAQMFTALALMGLVLAVVGIFSVMSLAVGQRTREIGVRMAIGAHRVDIGRMVVRRVFASVALGLAGGLAASLALAGLVRSLLYGVGPTDPVNIAVAALVFMGAALLAAVLPARRAASVDPMRSLRAE